MVGGVGIREVGQVGVAVRALLVARQAEAPHSGVDIPAVAQGPDEPATWTRRRRRSGAGTPC